MTYEEIVKSVENGAKFTINFQKRTCRVNGNVVVNEEIAARDWKFYEGFSLDIALRGIEVSYQQYKHSVPSERSESHRRYYFKALPEKELTDDDMMYGMPREVARCKLEFFVLMMIMCGALTWQEEWGSWFWQSPADKDLIILRDWIEPNKGGE